MRALGKAGLPDTLTVNGVTFRHRATLKHDFFAATGFYEDADGRRVVLKVGRVVEFAGVPLLWVGRWLCRREVRFYSRLSDLPNVPAVLGTWGPTGFVHDYVPGRPLHPSRPVPDGFFDQLVELLKELHRRGVAYVDTNKPENILLGDDGRPHLIDFQISWDLIELGDTRLNRWWLARLQREDIDHILKHKKRLRPDEMTEQEREQVGRRSALIRLHRFVFKPYFRFRRRTFSRLRETGRLLPEGSK
jgi:RIO-like serine/threonine protein kinase